MIVGATLAMAGCPGLLPGTDRAFDASVGDVPAPMSLDEGVASRPVDAPGAVITAMDAGADRPDSGSPAAPDVGTPVDRGAPSDVPAPVDRGTPDVGVPDVGRDPPGCGGEGRGGQPCCHDDRCNDGYLCQREEGASAVCARCGGNDEICCEDDRCDGRRNCEDGRCH